MGASAYWRAVGLLRLDRPQGLRELEGCFSAGTVPAVVDGPLRGRLVATTIGHGLDPVFETTARVWMPWQGKTFDHGRTEGRNLFSPGVRRLLRVTLPGYDDVRYEGERCSAFRFLTSSGPSALDPGVDVLRIDYRSVVENPDWPVRRVLDELVAVDDGLYLGQALLLWRGAMRRAAWFSLEH
ncbi:MAG: hypothetical protein ACRDV1_08960 [Actinomycetes bacterium]